MQKSAKIVIQTRVDVKTLANLTLFFKDFKGSQSAFLAAILTNLERTLISTGAIEPFQTTGEALQAWLEKFALSTKTDLEEVIKKMKDERSLL